MLLYCASITYFLQLLPRKCRSIMMANRDNPSSLIILDARPRANAEANRAVGAGYEKVN